MKTFIDYTKKKIYFFLILATITAIETYGQAYIYTPEGRPVSVIVCSEFSPSQIAYYNNEGDQYVVNYGLNAVRIGDASNVYNCHDYAWSVSEGGDRYWINHPNQENFWWDQVYSNDGAPSYVECSEQEATHAAYGDEDHSVRRIRNSYPMPETGGRDYVSKWGAWGLYNHQKAHDPYYEKQINIFNFKKLKTTHSGNLAHSPKTWIGAGGPTHNLTGNVTVPSGVTLTIKSGAAIKMNGYTLTSTGGTINYESGVISLRPTDFITGNSPYGVAIGELNNDGKQDMVVTNSNSNNVSVYLNTATAGASIPSFTDRTDFSVGSLPLSVAIGDFNGDNKKDLAVVNGNSNTVSILLNTTLTSAPVPTFSAKTDFGTSYYPNFVVVGDLNNDSKPDMVVANNETDIVSVFLNTTATGAPTPSFSRTDIIADLFPTSIAIDDLNADGKLDLAVANQDGGNISVFLNSTSPGVTTFSFSTKTNINTEGNPVSVVIEDLNGDSKPDIAFANWVSGNQSTISVYWNTTPSGATTPTFSNKTDIISGIDPKSIAVGDLNNDGRSDIAVVNNLSNTLFELLNMTSTGASTPTFVTGETYSTGNQPKVVAVGELNSDGKLDLAVTSLASNFVSVFLNTKTPITIIATAGIGGTITPSGTVPVNFGDDQTFTIAPNPCYRISNVFVDDEPIGPVPSYTFEDVSTSHTISAVFNMPTITATAGPNGTISPSGDVTVCLGDDQTFTITPNPGYHIADVLVDGTPVGPVGNYTFNNITTNHMISASFYWRPIDLQTGVEPRSVASGDLNNDGKPDLAVANTMSNTFSVFQNTTSPGATTPSFSSKIDFATGTYALSIAIGDFNGDGWKDIVVANAGSDKISVYLNDCNSTPSFSNRTDFPTGDYPNFVAVADLNADNKPDMVVANNEDNIASVFMNTTVPFSSTPSFSRTDIVAEAWPTSIAIGDLNGDNKPDLAVANYDCNMVSVFLNTTSTGAVTFTYSSKTNITTEYYPASVAVGDINSDNKPDLVVANKRCDGVPGEDFVNVIAVFVNTTVTGAQTPTFSAATNFTVGDYPEYVTIGDLNGDNKQDLVAVCWDTKKTYELLNVTASGSSTPRFYTVSNNITASGPTSIAVKDLNSDGKIDLAVTSALSNIVSVFLNTTQAVTGNISGYTTWSGYINVEGNVTLSGNVTLTINPGAVVFIKQGCKIEESTDSKINANGISENKIVFARYDNNAWDRILLKGDDNQFSWCLFDGGTYNVDVQSTGNTFSNCTFKNAGSGITSDRVYGTSNWSSFSLDHCMFQENQTGIYLKQAHADIDHTTIEDNNVGLYLELATIYHFTENLITQNHTHGIVVSPFSNLWMGNGTQSYPLSTPPPEGAGLNYLLNNGSTDATKHEIFVDGWGAQLHAGELSQSNQYLSTGYNKISSTTGKYICNSAYTWAGESQLFYYTKAQKNYWGEDGAVGPTNFTGNVDYSHELTSDPIVSPGAGSGNYPLMKVGGLANGNTPATVLTSTIASKMSENRSETSQKQFIVDLKYQMLEVRQSIADERNHQYMGRLLSRLNMLARLDLNNETGEEASISALLAIYRERLSSSESMDQSDKLCSEAAFVNELGNSLYSGDIKNVKQLLAKYSPYIQNIDNKRAVLFAEMEVYQALGEYSKAWESLKALKAIRPEERRAKAYVAPSYDAIEISLRKNAEAAGIVLDEGQNAKSTEALPKQIALLQNYPNPFNPMTTIKYELPASARVSLKVYDMLGREVAVLHDGIKEAGYWTATFDASKLSSGVYFSRLVVQSGNGEMVTQVKKMLLVK